MVGEQELHLVPTQLHGRGDHGAGLSKGEVGAKSSILRGSLPAAMSSKMKSVAHDGISLGECGNKHSTKYDFRQQFSQPAAGVTDAAPTGRRRGAGPQWRLPRWSSDCRSWRRNREPYFAKQGTVAGLTGKPWHDIRTIMLQAAMTDGRFACPAASKMKGFDFVGEASRPWSLQAPSIGQYAGEELLRRRRRSRLGNPHTPVGRAAV